MIRKALVITAPSPPYLEQLEGPISDASLIKAFLQKDIGGGFKQSEIVELEGSKSGLVLSELAKLRFCDFAMVYFSGHGYRQQGGDLVMLQDGYSLPVDNILGSCKRQVTIIDACRDIIDRDELIPFGGLGDAPQAGKGDVQAARKAFEQLLKTLPPGALHLVSCSKGQSSRDTPSGGAFTKALLAVSQRLAVANRYGDIRQVMNASTRQINDWGQIPEFGISQSWQDQHIPLALNKGLIEQYHVEEDYSGWVALGLIGLTAFALSRNS